MVLVCHGCALVCRTNTGLTRHINNCPDAKRVTMQAIEDREAAKIARKNLADVAQERNVLFAIPEIEVPDNLGQLIEPEPSNLHIPLPPTRSGRQRRFPAHRFVDHIPSSSRPIPHIPIMVPEPRPQSPPRASDEFFAEPIAPQSPVPEDEIHYYVTEPNEYGLYRVYRGRAPQHDPEGQFTLESLCDSPELVGSNGGQRPWWSGLGSDTAAAAATLDDDDDDSEEKPPYAPFQSASSFRLANWHYSASEGKSIANLDTLIKNVILAPDFNPQDFQNFSAATELKRIDDYFDEPGFSEKDGWKKASVKVQLPCDGHKFTSEQDAPTFTVDGVWYRDLVQIVESACTDNSAANFHLIPNQLKWRPSENAEPVDVVSELYNSQAMNSDYVDVLKRSHNLGCELEPVIIALQAWSDSTHLANFGTASLWPIYAYFGNLSKYVRGKPTSFSAQHLAYLPTLPDTIQETYQEIFGVPATAAVLTHLKRELMHAIWDLILTCQFMAAYIDGLVIKFWDGIFRRVFIRFYTYSADYPEKILLASIRMLGICCCPRCLVTKEDICAMGTILDMNRRHNLSRLGDNDSNWQQNVETVRGFIFKLGYAVNSAAVERILAERSLVPTRNTFLDRFRELFNFVTMFVVDLLHEFELGVWKATFAHLLRILYAAGGDAIQELNRRYREVPTFGRDTIRRFNRNASGMKKLAGRDFEDLLQCAMPVFEDLLPAPHNAIVLDLLFYLATWHAFAKMRLHTATSLYDFKGATAALGRALRQFANKTCKAYITRDLPQEEAARGRRRAARDARALESGNQVQPTPTSGPKVRKFNLSTYKLHALGDYPNTILEFGTTDNYTTQVGELEHRRVKRFYSRTNKMNFVGQITKHQRRERLMHKISQRMAADEPAQPATGKACDHVQGAENISYSDPRSHYHISSSKKGFENVTKFLAENKNTPACKDFLPLLKNHLLSRIRGEEYTGEQPEYPDRDRNPVAFVHNRIYEHQTLRINYTSYDMRRCQDVINVGRPDHANVIVLGHEDGDDGHEPHPFWYARVIGIFHADVKYCGGEPVRMDFLWVVWYGRDLSHRSGWRARRLPRIGLLEEGNPEAFGFLDPNDVVRASHLIPSFKFGYRGMVTTPCGLSISRLHKDWVYFYVDFFVDRDMFVRYRGDGVGHASARQTGTGREDFEGAIPEEQTPGDSETAEGINSDNEQVDENDLEDWGYVNEEGDVVVEGEATDDDGDGENERAPDDEYGEEGYAPL